MTTITNIRAAAATVAATPVVAKTGRDYPREGTMRRTAMDVWHELHDTHTDAQCLAVAQTLDPSTPKNVYSWLRAHNPQYFGAGITQAATQVAAQVAPKTREQLLAEIAALDAEAAAADEAYGYQVAAE